jgi:DNA-binding winged helix-turn-helix (wHTH) protein/tetratricopeptide (TPR) repeat protein
MPEFREVSPRPIQYRFDEFCLETVQRTLLRNGQIVPLPSKVFSLLLVLVQNQGVELSKNYLMETVWADSCVEPSNLTQSIFLLRRALGQDSDGRRLIVTIPGQGYLFTGPTQATYAGRPVAESGPNVSSSGRDPKRKSIAVLPFQILDRSSKTQYLGVSIADALINRLSKIQRIEVRATSAVLRYQGNGEEFRYAGRELGVGLLITGTVCFERRRTSSCAPMRVTVQMVNMQDENLVWSDSVEYDFSKLLSLQDTLAERIGRALDERLSAEELHQITRRYTDNEHAYRNYLKGRYYASQWSVRGWRKAIECFSRAVDQDPTYALAHSGIADAHYMASNLYSPPNQVMPQAQMAAKRALQLDPTLAEAHISNGLVQGFFEWKWDEAESSFTKAIELDPLSAAAHLWYGRLLATAGRFEEAIAQLTNSQRIEPLSPSINAELGRALYYARRYREASEQLRETLELDPNFWPAHLFLGWVYEQQNHLTEAVAILRRSSDLDDNPRTRASLGVAYAFAGEEIEAERILLSLMEDKTNRRLSAYYIAVVHAALGDHTRAFRWFQKAFTDKSEWLVWLRVDPRLDALREDPRFEILASKIGIPSNSKRNCAAQEKEGVLKFRVSRRKAARRRH